MPPRDLVLLTSEYPFGTAGEAFLEGEIPILAQAFRRVFILPSDVRPTQRPVPGNVEIVRMAWTDTPTASLRLRSLVDLRTAQVLRASAGTYAELLEYRRRLRVYVDVLARNILKARELAEFVRARGLQDAVFYDYWFENSTLALALCRLNGPVQTAVSRAHGYDLYDEGFGGIPVPFRQAKARGLDAVFPVSVHGESYLAERVPALAGKLEVHRLGVADPGRIRPEPRGDLPLVISCAALVPEKRIDLIPEVIAATASPVRWVHLGDGPERQRVVAAASRHLDVGRWELLGELPNSDVLAYYAGNPVRALLSLSRTEGVPVSMMEAQSYGVPVVATDVGAVAEIVTPETGILLAADVRPRDAADAVDRAVAPGAFDPLQIRRNWGELYNGPHNYAALAEVLLSLGERRSASPDRPRIP